MKQSVICTCLLSALLLTACGANSSGSGEESGTETGTTTVTAETTAANEESSGTDAPESSTADSQADTQTTEQTTGQVTGQTSAKDESSAAITTLFERQEPTAMISTTVTEAVLGGQGGEEHGEDPAPLYFNYRFSEDAVSMRLAGGNYQSVSYDFSKTVAHAAGRDIYTLADFNFDGEYDLCVPVDWDGDNVYHAVFLWDNETSRFSETPLSFINPIVCPESRLVCEISYDGKIAAEMTQREWFEGYLDMKMVVSANFDALALAVADDMTSRQPTKTESFDTREALEKAFLSYLPG